MTGVSNTGSSLGLIGSTIVEPVSTKATVSSLGRRMAIMGDSIALNAFGGPASTQAPITFSKGIGTLDLGGAWDQGVGNTFILQRTADPLLNFRTCTCIDQMTRNKIRFTVAGYTPPDGKVGPESDSVNIAPLQFHYTTIQNYFNWCNAYLGGYWEPTLLWARNGWRVDELYALFNQRKEELIDNIDWAWINIGVNSFSIVDQYGTPDQLWAYLREMLDYLRSIGVVPIVNTVVPVSTAGGWANGDARRPRAIYYNNKIRQYCNKYQGQVILCDMWKLLVDPASANSNYLAAYTLDGVHPVAAAGVKVGRVIATVIQNMFPRQLADASSLSNTLSAPSQYDSWASMNGAGFGAYASQILTNPGFQGTGGTSGAGITGSTPTGWTSNAQGTATATVTIAANPQGTGNEVSYAITSVANADTILLYQLIATPNNLVGKKFRVGVTVDVASPVNLKKATLSFSQQIAGSTSGNAWPSPQVMENNAGSTADGLGSIALGRSTLLSAPMAFQTTVGNSQFSISMEFWGSGGATIKLSEPFIQIVD